MTVEQFISALDDLGEAIETGFNGELLDIGNMIASEIRGRAPVDEGDLRNSIYAVFEDNALKIRMFDYGMFQNYGVRGVDGGNAVEVQFGVTPRPAKEPFYQFKDRQNPDKQYNYERYGISPQNFFDVNEIADRIALDIVTQIEGILKQ